MTKSRLRPEPVASYLAAVDDGIPRWLRSRRALLGELADGLDDAVDHYRAQGLSTQQAAEEAVKETGPPSLVADSFAATLAEGHARHTVLLLLATGPLIGVAWLTALVPGKPPTELLAQIPFLVPIVCASVFIGGLTLLVTGPATLRPSWVRLPPPRLAAFACACAAGGDLLMIASAISIAPPAPGEVTSGVPLLGAVLLSSVRLAITQRVVRRDLARPR